MKHLISATLTTEACEVWESWPKGSRSRQLSTLLEESGTLMLQKQALSLRVGHFQGVMASYRTNLLRFLRLKPPYDRLNRVVIEGMIMEINENCFGTVHYDPSLDPDNFIVDEKDGQLD